MEADEQVGIRLGYGLNLPIFTKMITNPGTEIGILRAIGSVFIRSMVPIYP